MTKAPLGPIKRHSIWVRTGPYGDDVEWLEDYYTDQYGNEYNSVEHVALCAVSAALKPT